MRVDRIVPAAVFAAMAAGLLSMPVAAGAHEHWIDLSSYRPAPGESLEVSVCSGHYYPKSAFALKDKVTGMLFVAGPGGVEDSLATVKEDKVRKASLKSKGGGVRVLGVELRRPGMDHPAYEMKAIMIEGTGPDDPASYGTGRGLEIVPLEALTGVEPGAKLKVAVTLDGEPVECGIEIVPADGRTAWYECRPDDPALVAIGGPGRYLVTASHSGRGCSLTFSIEGAGR